MSLLNNINVNTNDIKKKIYKIRGWLKSFFYTM
jgi:hypothetical protein